VQTLAAHPESDGIAAAKPGMLLPVGLFAALQRNQVPENSEVAALKRSLQRSLEQLERRLENSDCDE
jgi:hypothetical protein